MERALWPSSGHLSEQWNTVWVVSPGKLWQRWWRWEAEPLIISWQDNNVPCCLFVFTLFFRGYSALRVERTVWGGVMFCMIVKTVCSRSNEYFWRALPLLFSFFCLIIPYKYYQKCCYACFCAIGRVWVGESIFNCAWIQIVVLEEEDEEEDGRTRTLCDARRWEWRWVKVQSGWGRGEASGTPSLYESQFGSAWIMWVISALCLCGCCNRQPYQMCKV